jgi:hypothetical protein
MNYVLDRNASLSDERDLVAALRHVTKELGCSVLDLGMLSSPDEDDLIDSLETTMLLIGYDLVERKGDLKIVTLKSGVKIVAERIADSGGTVYNYYMKLRP